MSEKMRERYPGAYPFTDDRLSRLLFHGREQESTALAHQILAHRLVVLFARSGIGKTSLLNAGVAEKLRSEGFLPLTVRVNDANLGPLESVYRGIAAESQRQGVQYKEGKKLSLWHFFKTAEFWQEDFLMSPVLILDQFEELFTLQSEQQRSTFVDEFSYLVRGVRPKDPPRGAEEGTISQVEVSDTPPPIKIVVSLREDFLASLEELADRIPEILDQRFRLLPLARPAALRALEEPTAIEDPTLRTRPFEIDSRAKESILDFLERRTISRMRRSSNYVEPFQLQLICQYIEEIAERKQREGVQGVVNLTPKAIGGESRMRKILKDFYTRQVAAVPSFRQKRGVKILCTEFLISPQGRRLRMEESEIKRLAGVKPDILRTLVDRRLLRVDHGADGTYYELGHDTLIGPVLDSRRMSFLIRAVVFLIFVLVLMAMSVFLLFGMWQEIIRIIEVEAAKVERKPGEILFIVFSAGFLVFFLLSARRNFFQFLGMQRRARAERRSGSRGDSGVRAQKQASEAEK